MLSRNSGNGSDLPTSLAGHKFWTTHNCARKNLVNKYNKFRAWKFNVEMRSTQQQQQQPVAQQTGVNPAWPKAVAASTAKYATKKRKV